MRACRERRCACAEAGYCDRGSDPEARPDDREHGDRGNERHGKPLKREPHEDRRDPPLFVHSDMIARAARRVERWWVVRDPAVGERCWVSAFRARPLPSRLVGRPPFDPWREIHDRGDADLALAFGRLFSPVFVERRGCIVIEHRAVEEAIAEALEQAGGDVRRVEELLNRVSLRQEMPSEESDVEDETFMEIGRIMQRGWMAALAEQFPGREFVVELLDSEEDWHGPTLYLMSVASAGPV